MSFGAWECSFLNDFKIYTNDQSVHDATWIFIYADDLTAQYHIFSQVEGTIEEVLGELTDDYRNNSMCAKPDVSALVLSIK